MSRTPGMLNPLSYSSDAAFKKALLDQGRLAGWTPMSLEDDDEETDDN